MTIKSCFSFNSESDANTALAQVNTVYAYPDENTETWDTVEAYNGGWIFTEPQDRKEILGSDAIAAITPVYTEIDIDVPAGGQA